jgi:hypothetical protein
VKQIISAALAVVLVALGFTVAASPAYAGRSACASGYVCAWQNAGWTGTMAMFDPGYIQSLPNNCLNINSTSLQDAISSLASYSGAELRFFNNIGCSGSSFIGLFGYQQIKDLAGSGFNDATSSVQAP